MCTSGAELLAVTGSKRDVRFPNTPTAQEAGLNGFALESWVGILAPAATPLETLLRLNRAVANSIDDPMVRRQLLEIGLQPDSGPAGQFGNTIRRELTLHRKIAADAKLKFE